MAVERFIADQKYVIPDELVGRFDDLVELMMSTDDQAFYDLAKEFDNEFGQYACRGKRKGYRVLQLREKLAEITANIRDIDSNQTDIINHLDVVIGLMYEWSKDISEEI